MALNVFDKIVAELLEDPSFRKLVCPNKDASNADKLKAAEAAIGKQRWKKLDDPERKAVIEIACKGDDLKTTDLDAPLASVGKDSSVYFTDW